MPCLARPLAAAALSCLAGVAPLRAQLNRAQLERIERPRVLAAAGHYLLEKPITITAYPAARSAGGPHDYFSEGDYWWPDPRNPDGPYIQRDGQTNPANFDLHRQALRRLSQAVPALVAAYELTRDERYARAARAHLVAWFADTATRMNPSLRYAQAIHGRVTGRGIGIIDGLHLVEVAQAVAELERLHALPADERAPILGWFRDYLEWITTDPFGAAERDNGNNHSTAWAVQVAEFARLLGDSVRLAQVRRFYEETLLPKQMAADGSFPKELARTKPYSYSLFNLDLFAELAQILSTPAHGATGTHGASDLWRFTLADGRGLHRAIAWMAPYIADKRAWPRPPDVQYFDEWPMRQVALLFGGLAYHDAGYIALWKKLPADSEVDEVIRNFPIRQPLLWVH
ncbi:MAG TPA: alginate lyase family protein [Longimicrobiales bacterium]